MIPREFILGAVYQPDWHASPIRVIAFDSEEVMYDTWWPGQSKWGLSSLSGTVSYYRTSAKYFLEHANYLRTEEFSPKELEVHRPDLPFSFGQSLDLQWSDSRLNEELEILNNIEAIQSLEMPHLLMAPKIYLSPFGPKGGVQTGVLIESENGVNFTATELLRHAFLIQRPLLRHPILTQGIVIYRSGIKRQLPSYYIWGARRMSAI